jgi:serine-type D-Ala-D-Ala carboxypeptidase
LDKDIVVQSMKENVKGRGIGWQVSETYPKGCGHSGFTGSSLWLVPEKKIAVCILTSRLHTKENIYDLSEFRKELHNAILEIL